MNGLRAFAKIAAFAVGLGGTSAALAAPGGVAYIDGGQVHVATLDGAKKVQLSGGDAWWNAVTQSATGGVLGTKNEPGKIAQLTSFQTWTAGGAPERFGPLNSDSAGSSSLAMPLTLALTASNGLMLYGFSGVSGIVPNAIFTRGYYAQSTQVATVMAPIRQTALQWVSVGGDRVVGTTSDTDIAVLNADQNFVGNQTTPWISINTAALPGAQIHRTAVSGNGTVLAAEVAIETNSSNSTYEEERVWLVKSSGFAGTYVDDCFVPAVGRARYPSVSPDGTLIAWTDDQGVKVAGAPDFSGPATCALTRPPVVVSPTGTSPALGPIDVDAIWAARNPSTTTPTTPPTTGTPTIPLALTAQPPATVTARALTARKGIVVTIGAPIAGTARITVTVLPKAVGRRGTKPIVIATGALVVAKAAANLKIRVRPTTTGRALAARLKGKRVTITTRIGTKRVTKTVRLR